MTTIQLPSRLTEPFRVAKHTRGSVHDFDGQQVELSGNGRFIFESTAQSKSARIVIKDLYIHDNRVDETEPAITFRNLQSSTMERITVNRAGTAILIDECFDTVLDQVTCTNGIGGVQVRRCNNVVMRCLRVEKMTGLSLQCLNSREIVVDRESKFHGIPYNPETRTMIAFGNCGSVDFSGRIMHAKPDEDDGIILVYGPRTESIVMLPVIRRTGDGPAIVLRNVPHNLRSVIQPIEHREPSLVDPK